ncbi:MAG: hypothetical protein K0R31_2026 [Clostridiales bacterium]|jgi:hypothetical protein|nr:hypothetical protein [Clostridiales bacterium]
MVDAYFYLPAEKLEDVMNCGMKLSEWFNREAVICGELRKCISALLHPKDDYLGYKSDKIQCIKLEVSSESCYVADRSLYLIGLENSDVRDLYTKSIRPVKEYLFGSYRLPECLIIGTVIAEQISLLDKRMDSPLLFNSSEELYINNILELYKEKHSNFNDTLIYYFYCMLKEKGKVDKIEDTGSNVAVFRDKDTGLYTTVKIPEIKEYL